MFYKVFKYISSVTVGIMSCGIYLCAIVVLGAYFIINHHVWRDDVIKNNILPLLPQFDIPQFSYDKAYLNTNQALIINDIKVFDDTKQSFATIKSMTVTPKDFFDIFKGIIKVKFDTVTILKKPVFKNTTGNAERPFAMPKIPFDIQNFHINNIIIKPKVINNPKDIHININGQHISHNNQLLFDIKPNNHNQFHIVGNIQNNIIKTKIYAHNFNVDDVFFVHTDIQKFFINATLTLDTNIQNLEAIPNINGTAWATALYKNIPVNAKINGEYLHNKLRFNVAFHHKDNLVLNANVLSHNAKTGKLNIVFNTQTLPTDIQNDIPIIADNIHITTDFIIKDNDINIINGQLTSQALMLKNTIQNIPIRLHDINIKFHDTLKNLKIQNASFKTFLNQTVYDTQLSVNLYDYYRPKKLLLKMLNPNNPSNTATLNLDHNKNLDNIHVNIAHLNPSDIVPQPLFVQISDFNTDFKGNLNLFAKNILQTVNGTFTNSVHHTNDNNITASATIKGTLKNGATSADYSFLLNNKPIGTGNIHSDNQFNHIRTTINSDLQALNIFLENTGHHIAGTLIANVNMNNAVMTGDIKINNGTYHNQIYGTVIDNIDIHTTMSPNSINVITATGNSTPTGTVTAKGIISLSKDVVSSLKISSTNLNPVKHDIVSVNLNSNLELVGNNDNLKLVGNMNLDDLLILLPDVQSNHTPSLNIITPTTQTTDSTDNTIEPVPLLERIQTDIAVTITQGAKITGFGVQGFPFGTLNITGTLGTPQTNGQINIARGKIDFFGKNFKITKGGLIIKDNKPLFNIASEHSIKKKIINLSLKGTLKNPDIVLSSTPQIPKDEIIALLVFGADKKELSPFQALQLANTVYQLSRGKSGANSSFDIVGKTERLLNIDELNVNSSDDNSLSIGAGKYISEDIYVATEYNPITANNIFRLELKLTDTIDIISRLNTTNKVNNTNNSEIMLIKNTDY